VSRSPFKSRRTALRAFFSLGGQKKGLNGNWDAKLSILKRGGKEFMNTAN